MTNHETAKLEVRDSDIAVVGTACRFPGARNTEEFWRNLRNGVESVEFLSDEELLREGVSTEKIRDPQYVKARASLADMEMFDARFFGFSPRDAAIMDPQHRHFLECAYECLENAGHAPGRFPGSIGVFAGSGCNLYLIHHLFSNPELIDEIGFFQVKHTGNDKDYLATRLSYCLNLTGPSVNLQTACSTSLVAIHMGCQSLLNGECDLALCGGATIDVTLRAGYRYQEGEVLSADGHCHAFDHRARGTIFGNGAGVVALRRLRDAIRDGDTIQAVVKGSAINNDGSSKVGYFAPSVQGQYEAVLQALGVASVPADSITYIEAHGTGTIVGDPIEVRALAEAFQTQTRKSGFCGIGSVKTNVGHLDTAAGVASFIKVVESLRHRELPPSLGFERPNPAIDFDRSPFYVNDRLRSWTANGYPRRAGVNSLAVGGTNAHVILEEAPATEPSGPSRPYQLLVLSARTDTALDAASINLSTYLKASKEPLADVAFTLQTGRTEFEHRRVLVTGKASDAAGVLGAPGSKRLPSLQCPDEPAGVAFLFTGQGAQYPGMASEVYRSEPAFRRVVDRCSEVLGGHLGFDLAGLLFRDDIPPADAGHRLRQTAVTQPALFVVEYALASLWAEWGIQPGALIGHSIGEYVAATVAGVFSLEDALRLVAARGRLMQAAPPGGMLAVHTGEAEIAPFLTGAVSLAAVNGPSTSVVSGPGPDIEALEKRLEASGIQFVRLQTSHAFHSSMMDGVLDPYRAEFDSVDLKDPKIPFVSNVSGNWIDAGEATDPDYWVRHLRQPVRFAPGLETLLGEAEHILLEVGPGSTLAALARQHPSSKSARAIVASLPGPRDKSPSPEALLTALGHLWLNGVTIDWDGFYSHERRRRIPLPAYPFEHRRHWIERGRAPLAEAPGVNTRPERDVPSTGRRDFAQWFWKPVWKRAPWPGESGEEGRNWLVFAGNDPVSTAVLEHLRHRVSGTHSSSRIRRLILEEPGDAGNLKWRSAERAGLEAGQVEIEVHAAGLNFRDVLIALGGYPEAASARMGSECAGVVTRIGGNVSGFSPGDAVVACAPGFQTHVAVDARMVAPIPPNLTLEQAVTIPLSFMTAHYALSDVANLRAGERVLIHAAAGGVGLAAVQIAHSRGAEVFATAGNDDKRNYLRSLGIGHVFDSRSLDFADRVLDQTGGEGVDVVLNALAGEYIVEGLRTLRPLGRFLEIGKADIYGNKSIHLEPFKKNISFSSIDLEVVCRERPDFYGRRFKELIARFAEGTLTPLPSRVFPIRRAPEAFDYMAKAKHIGKIVLTVAPEPSSLATVRTGDRFSHETESEYTIDPNAAEDYQRVFEQMHASGRFPDRILHLWNARPNAFDLRTAAGTRLEDSELHGFYSLLYAAQALAGAAPPTAVRMAVVSTDVQTVDGQASGNPIGALALGPAGVVPREVENVSSVSVDVSSADAGGTRDPGLAERLVSEVETSGKERVIAYRRGERFVQAFEPVPLRMGEDGPASLRRGGVYVITGAFGGIGLVLASHLARNFAARLVLIGRTPLPPREEWEGVLERGDFPANVIRTLTEIDRSGCEFSLCAADVADEERLGGVIDEARQRFGAIHGVFHCAGHVDDAPLLMKTARSAADVLRPKVRGTLALLRQFDVESLDFFVVFSSISAITAPAGQIDYAAANAFLGALAGHMAASQRGRVVAIDWGAWREVGMAVRAVERTGANGRGLGKSASMSVHPLIEGRAVNGSEARSYSTRPLGVGDWLLGEHRLRGNGRALLPGTGYLELIRGAFEQQESGGGVELRNVAFRNPFSVESGERRRLEIHLQKDGSAWEVSVTSPSNGGGGAVEHVTARIGVVEPDSARSSPIEEIRRRCQKAVSPPMDGGPLLRFGPRWRNLTELRVARGEALGKLELAPEFSAEVHEFRLHPALVDIAVACGFPLVEDFDPASDSYVPLGCERLVARSPLPAKIFSHVRYKVPRKKSTQVLTFDVALLDEDGRRVVEIDGFTFKKVRAADLAAEPPNGNGSGAVRPPGSGLEEAVRQGISPEEGVRALERILQDGRFPEIVVSPLDLPRQLDGQPLRPPSTADIERDVDAAVPQVPETSPGAGPEDIEGLVTEVLKRVLGVSELSPDEDFFEMGGDSLSAMRVVTQLKNRFSTSLPIGTLFENRTAKELTEALREKLA